MGGRRQGTYSSERSEGGKDDRGRGSISAMVPIATGFEACDDGA